MKMPIKTANSYKEIFDNAPDGATHAVVKITGYKTYSVEYKKRKHAWFVFVPVGFENQPNMGYNRFTKWAWMQKPQSKSCKLDEEALELNSIRILSEIFEVTC